MLWTLATLAALGVANYEMQTNMRISLPQASVEQILGVENLRQIGNEWRRVWSNEQPARTAVPANPYDTPAYSTPASSAYPGSEPSPGDGGVGPYYPQSK